MMTYRKTWFDALHAMRFTQLFVFSLGAMLLQALLQQSLLLSLTMNLLFLNALLVTLSAEGVHRLFGRALMGLWLLSFSLRLWAPAGMEQDFALLSKGSGCLLLAICIGSMSHYMFFRRRITIDTLFAGMVIYLLIALLFAQLYSITGNLLPGSFAYPPDLPLVHGNLPDISYNYFSFVTIATLGYGDIAPRHPVAQMLASIEAVIGQFYVAILVARLVSLYAATKRAYI